MSEKIIKPERLLQHIIRKKKYKFDDIEDDIKDFDFNDKKNQILTNMV